MTRLFTILDKAGQESHEFYLCDEHARAGEWVADERTLVTECDPDVTCEFCDAEERLHRRRRQGRGR